MVNHSSPSFFLWETNEAQLCPDLGGCKGGGFNVGRVRTTIRDGRGRKGRRDWEKLTGWFQVNRWRWLGENEMVEGWGIKGRQGFMSSASSQNSPSHSKGNLSHINPVTPLKKVERRVCDCCVWHLIWSQGLYLFLSCHETAPLLRNWGGREGGRNHVSPLWESSFVHSGGCDSFHPEHFCAKPPNSQPGNVKFTFSVYLSCLWHSTTHQLAVSTRC